LLDPTIIEVLKYLIVHGMPLKPTLLHINVTSSSSISYLIPNAAKNTYSSFSISIVAKTISCTFFIVGFMFTSLSIPLVIGIISTPFLKQWQQGLGSLRKIVSFHLNFVIEIIFWYWKRFCA
jgi:hypothetical protein